MQICIVLQLVSFYFNHCRTTKGVEGGAKFQVYRTLWLLYPCHLLHIIHMYPIVNIWLKWWVSLLGVWSRLSLLCWWYFHLLFCLFSLTPSLSQSALRFDIILSCLGFNLRRGKERDLSNTPVTLWIVAYHFILKDKGWEYIRGWGWGVVFRLISPCLSVEAETEVPLWGWLASAAASMTQLQSAQLAAACSLYSKPGAQFHCLPPEETPSRGQRKKTKHKRSTYSQIICSVHSAAVIKQVPNRCDHASRSDILYSMMLRA